MEATKRLSIKELENKTYYELNELLEQAHDDYESQVGHQLELSSFILDIEYVLETKKYYALFDRQIGGYKAGYASDDYNEVLQSSARRAYELSQSDEEPCDESLSDEDILEVYDYEIREVTREHYEVILDSEEIGLLKTVTLE